MEKFKATLELSGINTNYLNLNTLYGLCGEDLIKFGESVKSSAREDVLNKFLKKYRKREIATALFYHFTGLDYVYHMTYDI